MKKITAKVTFKYIVFADETDTATDLANVLHDTLDAMYEAPAFKGEEYDHLEVEIISRKDVTEEGEDE